MQNSATFFRTPPGARFYPVIRNQQLLTRQYSILTLLVAYWEYLY